MTRPYKDSFIRSLYDGDGAKGLGTELAKLCISAKLPAKYVAVALEVTPLTVFKWYRGSKVKPFRHERVTTFMSLVRQDMRDGVLPAANTERAKAYIYEMIGKEEA